MSIRHPELCALIERVCVAHDPVSEADLAMLTEYAEPVEGLEIEDQLDRVMREAVEEFTGRSDVWSPGRASRALLATVEIES